jgi:hypothetical protein
MRDEITGLLPEEAAMLEMLGLRLDRTVTESTTLPLRPSSAQHEAAMRRH